MRTAILDGVEAANREILDLKTGAGATLAVVQLDHGEAKPYHVGDSQILLVGNRGKVKLLTTSPLARRLRRRGRHARRARRDRPRGTAPRVELPRLRGHARRGGQRPQGVAAATACSWPATACSTTCCMDEIVDLLRTGSAATAAAQDRRARRGSGWQPPQDGKPHKPDDMTLIVFSQRGARGSVAMPASATAQQWQPVAVSDQSDSPHGSATATRLTSRLRVGGVA